MKSWSFLLFVTGVLHIAACGETPTDSVKPATSDASSEKVVDSLAAHSSELRRDLIEVTDSVAVAIGYGLGNSILVQGEGCAFVVDTTESREIGEEVLAAFRTLTDLPIEALIYTHNHGDHIFGADAFVEEGADIYAHSSTAALVDRAINIIRPILSKRSARMFGTYLPLGDNGLVNAGLGRGLGVTGPNGGSIGYLPPTRTFDSEMTTTICGVDVVMRHAPGETDDQIYVWLPDQKLLMPGDNIYKAFPNLYTIRGTRYRDVVQWANSLEMMRALGAAYLVPSHTRPVAGAEAIDNLLEIYGDGIRFVHDQTVRGMNMGLTPDELVEFVQLPPHLRDHPYLQEHYGTVRWSVRSIYDGYLGWFNGEGATLNPPTPAARARALQEIARSQTTLTDAAAAAFESGDHALAAELATHALAIDDNDQAARSVKAEALSAMAFQSTSPNGRNYLLSQAMELRGDIEIIEGLPDERSISFIRRAPVRNFMASLPVNLDAQAALDVQRSAEFRFTDSEEVYTIDVRRGVAVMKEGPAESPDIIVETTSDVWIDLLIGRRKAAVAIASGDLKFPEGLGDVVAFSNFMKLFRS